MLLFDAGRAEEALTLWRSATAGGHADPVALRNAALATFQLEGDGRAALALYEQAIAQRPDPRLVYEADQLRQRLGVSDDERMRALEVHLEQVLQRDDATVEYGLLLVRAGRLDEAEQLVNSRSFSPWEGGEGRTLELWDTLQLALSREREEAGDPLGALAAARRALEVPHSLGEARHPLSDTGRIHGRIAELLEAGGDAEGARRERERMRATTMVLPVLEDGSVDYFATSLPDLLLFPERN